MSRQIGYFAVGLTAALAALIFWAPGAAVGEINKNKRKNTGFLERTYTDSDGNEFKYSLFIPHAYNKDDEDTKYPVILFLHGHKQEGTDGVKPTRVGLGPYIKENEETFDFIVVFPQSQERWEADTADSKRAMTILNHVLKSYNCDPDKVTVTGNSQGGHGAWCLACSHPNRWAAMVIVAGFAGDSLDDAGKIKHIPARFYHGETDQKVKIAKGKAMFGALKEAGGDPEAIWDPGEDYPVSDEYPNGTHNADWFNEIYANKDLYDWLRNQSRK
jgi:predicted peptidase